MLKRSERGIESAASGRPDRLRASIVALVLVVLACVNHLYDLTPWGQVHGVFNTSDIGLLMLILMFFGFVLRRRTHLLTDNGFSILIIAYLFYSLVQAAVVSFNFGQSVIDGLIAVRHQFYYLSFFVFLAILDTPAKVERMLNVIGVLAIVLVIIGIVNYAGMTLYYHKWAEGHGIRSGITRAYISGMDIVTLGLFWLMSSWVMDSRIQLKRETSILILVVGHVLEQARGRIIGFFAAIIYVLFVERRYKTLAAGAAVFFLAVAVAQVAMEENIFLTPFVSAFTDVSEGTGSWRGRMQQLETGVEVFMEHPYFGSGTAALRVAEDAGLTGPMMDELSAIARKEDLGYAHWVKAYGIPGILWILTFWALLYINFRKVRNQYTAEYRRIALTATGYLSFVVVSFITLPHLMRPDLIILLCLALAILVKVRQFGRRSGVVSRNGSN